MALPATAVLEVRATATPGNLNGGGFNSALGGTDYTLQDAAQLTRADGTAAGTTTFGSVLGGFTDAMKGNYLHITASTGLTVGWYHIASVTDTNNVVLDRSPGTGSATTFYIGGAMSLASTLDDDFYEILVPGNKVWIKNGTYTMGESVVMSNAGTAALGIELEGYDSTRGDYPTGSTRPTLVLAANTYRTGSFVKHTCIMFTTTTAAGIEFSSTVAVNCKITNTSTTATRVGATVTTVGTLVNCEVISYRGYALASSSVSFSICYCYIHDSDIGIRSTGTGSPVYTIIGNIIESNVTAAIRFTGAAVNAVRILSNTLFGSINTTGIGVDLPTAQIYALLMNNIITGFVTGVAHADTQTAGYDDYNDYYNNDADVSAAGQWQKGSHDVAINPAFTNVGQITFTNGTTSGSVLTSSGADFSTVTDNVDFLYLVSGTGITAGQYKITAHSGTTLTLDIAPGTSATADKVGQVTTGRNFMPTGAI